MINTIEFLTYPRARMGWNHCHKIIDHLGKGDYKIPFVYSFETHELLILDDRLIEVLNFLQVPYDIVKPSQSINYIKEG
jgi:hypothetical protein